RARGRRSRSVVRHDFFDKQFDGVHRLCMAEATPLERTHEVIRPCGDILVHIHPHRVRGAGDDAEPGTPAITPNATGCGAAMLLCLRAGWRRVHTGGFTVWYAGGSYIPPEKLCQSAALSLQAARCHQVPDVVVPGWFGCRHGLALGVRQ